MTLIRFSPLALVGLLALPRPAAPPAPAATAEFQPGALSGEIRAAHVPGAAPGAVVGPNACSLPYSQQPSLSVSSPTVVPGGSVTFTWSADPIGTITYYELTYNYDNSLNFATILTSPYPLPKTPRSYVLNFGTGWTPGTVIYFSIFGTAASGCFIGSYPGTQVTVVAGPVPTAGPLPTATPTPTATPGYGCVADATTLCLSGGRFKVQSTWVNYDTPPLSGAGQSIPLTADTGGFWFFSPTNYEVVVKFVNSCGYSPKYSMYASGLTDVQTTLKVWDLKYGNYKEYAKPPHTLFTTLQQGDFTCP